MKINKDLYLFLLELSAESIPQSVQSDLIKEIRKQPHEEIIKALEIKENLTEEEHLLLSLLQYEKEYQSKDFKPTKKAAALKAKCKLAIELMLNRER